MSKKKEIKELKRKVYILENLLIQRNCEIKKLSEKYEAMRDIAEKSLDLINALTNNK